MSKNQAGVPADNNTDVYTFLDLPIPNKNRKRTDVFCTLCSGIFSLILFIICCVVFNNQNLKKMTYLTDAKGRTCATELKDQFPIVYFTSFNDPSKRLCVSKCPTQEDNQLSCYPTYSLTCYPNTDPKHQVTIYKSIISLNRIGLLCLPVDPKQKEIILEHSDLTNKYNFLQVYDSIWTSLWISIVFGIILIICIQCFSRQIVHWMFIFGFLCFISLAFVVFISVPNGLILFKIFFGIALLLMGILILFTILKSNYRKQIFICGRLIQISTLIVKQHPQILVFILIWWVLQCGLIALTGFEILCAWSFGELQWRPEYPFYQPSSGSFGRYILLVLIFIQFIWGLSFLKEAFNFCVSGFATQWYCFRQKAGIFVPFQRLIKYNWGSIVGGSLLLWIFYFIDLFFDFYENSSVFENRHVSQNPQERKMIYSRTKLQSTGCNSVLNLVRSQAFGYINLVSVPYCNASRYCQMLDQDTNFYDRSQTTNRLYRLSAHILIMTIATLIAFGANNHTDVAPNIFGIFFVSLVSLFSVTYFVAFHGDLAEGIYISIIVEERLRHIQSNIYEMPDSNGKNQAYYRQTLFVAPAEVKDLYVDDLMQAYQNTTIGEYLTANNNLENIYGFQNIFEPQGNKAPPQRS